jgi:hypothetical protein
MTDLDSVAIKALKHSLSQRFEMSDFDFCIFYLDMIIFKERELRKLILDQSVYVEQMLRDHEMWDCKSLIIFMNVFCRLIKVSDEYIADKSLKIDYQSIMRSLMYIMLDIRSNITYFIFVISRYVFNSTQAHWQAVKQIFRYLRRTYQMKLIFQKSLKRLQNYTNFDWVNDQNIKRFTSSYAFNINNEIISWFSKRQSIVTLFICEVEYIDQTQTVKEIIWLRNLLIQLICDIDYSQIVIIYENNQDVIALTKNLQFHAQIKHIDIQTHFIKEKVVDESIDLIYIFTNQMIIDDLTKSLIRNKFTQFQIALEIK